MIGRPNRTRAEGHTVVNGLKNWMIIIFALGFILLYGASLMGWLKPRADDRILTRLEPIIFVIIGYYFCRLPSQQAESALISEVNRQTQKAEAAQHAKEQALQAREALEEKVKSVRAALIAAVPDMTVKSFTENLNRADGPISHDMLRQSVATAFSILNS